MRMKSTTHAAIDSTYQEKFDLIVPVNKFIIHIIHIFLEDMLAI